MIRMQRLAWLVAAVALWAGAPGAGAGLVTFTYGSSANGETTISQTVDGITLTLFNPISKESMFAADSDGFGLGVNLTLNGNWLSSGLSLAVTGGTLELTGYEIGFADNAGSPNFSMSGGSGSSTGNSLASQGTYTANGNWQLAPGQVGTLSTQGFTSGFGWSQIKSLTFNVVPAAAVPEPGTVGLALMGAGVLGVRAWRRRGTRAAA